MTRTVPRLLAALLVSSLLAAMLVHAAVTAPSASAAPLSNITVNSTDSSSVFSQSVTLASTLTGSSVTPTGTVTFLDGVTPVCTNVDVFETTPGVAAATCATTALIVGTHAVTAEYGGDATYDATTSTPAFSQVVAIADTTTVVESDDDESVTGQPVTFTSTTSFVAPATLPPSNGTVSFNRNGTPIGACSAQPVTGGVATCSLTTLPLGTSAITAVYSGSSSYATSTATGASQAVARAETTVLLTSDDDTAGSDESVTFTATVSTAAPGTGVPTGTVAFFRIRSDLSRQWIGTTALSGGAATAITSSLPVGVNTVTAIYRGSNNRLASTDSVEQTITTTTSTTLTFTRSPAIAGRFIGFHATVTPSAGGGTPTGTVAFFRLRTGLSRVWVGTASLVNGVAKVRTDRIPVGTHTIIAIYRGAPLFGRSTGGGTQVITE